MASDSASGMAAARLIDALTRTDAPPSPDTVIAWMSGAASAAEFHAVAGNYRAILGTGDLRLVRRVLVVAGHGGRPPAALPGDDDRAGDADGAGAPLHATRPAGRRPRRRGDVPRMRRDPEAAAVLFAAHTAYMNRISGMKTLLRDTPEPARGPLSRARAAFGAVRKKASHRGHGGAPRRATNPNFLNGAPHRTCLTSAPGAQ